MNAAVYCNVDYTPLADFCRCVEKVVDKSGWVYIRLIDKKVRFHFYNSTSFVEHQQDVDANGSMMVGVDAVKFVSVFKNLYDEKIKFHLDGKKLKINQHNIKVKLAIFDYHDFDSPDPGLVINDHIKDWIVDSVCKCYFSSSLSTIADGILIDFGEYLRVCKMSHSLIRILTYDKPFQGNNSRFVISMDMMRLMNQFKTSVSSVSISNNKFGIVLNNNVNVSMPLMADTYPQNYISSLKLKDDFYIMNKQEYDKYEFDKEAITNAINMVSSVMSDDNVFVNFACVGHSEENNLPVWKIYGGSAGCEAEESVLCTEPGVVKSVSFGINKKDSYNIMKKCQNNVVIYNNGNEPLVISDLDGLDITLLLKIMV